MRNNNKLVRVIYTILNLSFWLFTLIITMIIVFDLFVEKGDYENIRTSPHHSEGYKISSQIQFHIPDTVIKFKSINGNKSGNISYSENRSFKKSYEEISNDSLLQKTYLINEVKLNNEFEDITHGFYKINSEHLSAEINIPINPKDNVFKIILILNAYLPILLLLYITFQLKIIFLNLKNNFKFNNELYKRIKLIGYSLIIFQTLLILISIFIRYKITSIDFIHYIQNTENSIFKFMTLNVDINFDFIPFLIGSCLLILSNLLKYGNNIQEENELTI